MAQATWQRVGRAASPLSTTAVRAMEELAWFAALPAEQRASVGLVVHTGVAGFAQWLRRPGQPLPVGSQAFAAAPRQLARAVNLKQTVQLIRIAVEVVEVAVPTLAAPGEEELLREAVLRYSRELAFAAADVYAAAAEARGAWDARVEAGIVDALVRGQAGQATLSRAASLGWSRVDWVVALATPAPVDLDVTALRADARHAQVHLLLGEASTAMVLVAGGTGEVAPGVSALAGALPDAPVVVGPEVAELLAAASSVTEAVAGLAAVAGWTAAPRPVRAAELLAERAVLGDDTARRRLLEEVYEPMASASGDLLLTAGAYLEGGGSLEGTGRTLFLHPNTVRYRLKRLREVTGRDLTDPRDAHHHRVALLLGRTRGP